MLNLFCSFYCQFKSSLKAQDSIKFWRRHSLEICLTPIKIKENPTVIFDLLEEHQDAQGPPHLHSFNLDCVRCGNVCCFADDSSFSFSSHSAENISEQIEANYATIADYMGSHELKLNSDKTHLLVIRSDAARRASPDFPVILNTGAENF